MKKIQVVGISGSGPNMPTNWKFETYFEIEPILGPDFIIDDFDSNNAKQPQKFGNNQFFI